ncbi:hypothetical protein ACKVWC_003490 [Pyricularia oryzae]
MPLRKAGSPTDLSDVAIGQEIKQQSKQIAWLTRKPPQGDCPTPHEAGKKRRTDGPAKEGAIVSWVVRQKSAQDV